MPRNIRVTVFISREEESLLASTKGPDASVGATLRQLALDRARWLADRCHRVRPGSAPRPTIGDGPYVGDPAGRLDGDGGDGPRPAPADW